MRPGVYDFEAIREYIEKLRKEEEAGNTASNGVDTSNKAPEDITHNSPGHYIY